MAEETTAEDRTELDAIAALRYATDGQLLGLVGVIVVGWWLTTLQFGLGAWPTAGIVPLHAIGRLLTELADTVSWFVGATAALVGTAATLYEIPVDARARGHRYGNRHAR